MSSFAQEIGNRLKFACEIAREAALGTLAHYCRADLQIEQKKDLTPVTVADREAEQLLRERISAHFSLDGIEGEEFGQQTGSSAFRWILDPIDGTRSFVSGVPLYGTMVGVLYEEEPQIGVLEFPALAESIYAAKGQGAWHSTAGNAPQKAVVSTINALSEGLFCTTAVDTFTASGRDQIFAKLQQRAHMTRTWGDCYGYLLVATGRAELMVDPELNLWDTAALMPILEEAGGTLTDFSGRRTVNSGEAIATNGHILNEVLEIASPSKGRTRVWNLFASPPDGKNYPGGTIRTVSKGGPFE